MNLELFFYLTQSVQAIILSLFFIVLTVLLIYSTVVVKKTSRRIRDVAEEGLETVHDAREYVNRMGKAVMDYLIVKSLGSINKKGKKRS